MTATRRPLIYISALRRTGSTLLSEALTDLPYSMIFRETHLGENIFAAKRDDAEMLRPYGIQLREVARRNLRWAPIFRRLAHLGIGGDYAIRVFRRKILAPLAPHVNQFGVKEVTHQGWRHFLRHFPTMKIILLARDPRDIYLSMERKVNTGSLKWKRPFNPATVARFLGWQASLQQEMASECECFKLRYEDLCRRPEKNLEAVRSFVDSPLPGIGEIGRFVGNQPRRSDEVTVHGYKITSNRVFIWRDVTQPRLKKELDEIGRRMTDYCQEWGYE